MKKNNKKTVTSEELSHLLLFAHQMSVPGVLRKGDTFSVEPILERIREIQGITGVNLVKGENTDEALDNYTKMLVDSELAKEAYSRKLGLEKYEIHIEGCPFAKDIHPTPERLKDVTCRHALVAAAILGKFCRRAIRIGESEFLVDGTKTIIECV